MEQFSHKWYHHKTWKTFAISWVNKIVVLMMRWFSNPENGWQGLNWGPSLRLPFELTVSAWKRRLLKSGKILKEITTTFGELNIPGWSQEFGGFCKSKFYPKNFHTVCVHVLPSMSIHRRICFVFIMVLVSRTFSLTTTITNALPIWMISRFNRNKQTKNPKVIQSIVLGIILDTPNYFGFGK